MISTVRSLSAISAALFALAASAAVGCLDGSPPADRAGPADAGDSAGAAEGEATAESQQELEISCVPSLIGADKTFANPPSECGKNLALSNGDLYVEAGCKPYIVEFGYKPKHLSAGFDHGAWSKEECNDTHADVTVYTFVNGNWFSNGTGKFHGSWSDGNPGPPSCTSVPDFGSSMPKPGLGTKWRVAVTAYAEACQINSVSYTCYTDYKRAYVLDDETCGPN